MDLIKEITYSSNKSGLIWSENINGPFNWSLEEIEPTGYSKAVGTYPKSYGDVSKIYNGKFRGMTPLPYDPETDSDAAMVGEFDTMEEAMRAVEESFHYDYFI